MLGQTILLCILPATVQKMLGQDLVAERNRQILTFLHLILMCRVTYDAPPGIILVRVKQRRCSSSFSAQRLQFQSASFSFQSETVTTLKYFCGFPVFLVIHNHLSHIWLIQHLDDLFIKQNWIWCQLAKTQMQTLQASFLDLAPAATGTIDECSIRGMVLFFRNSSLCFYRGKSGTAPTGLWYVHCRQWNDWCCCWVWAW